MDTCRSIPEPEAPPAADSVAAGPANDERRPVTIVGHRSRALKFELRRTCSRGRRAPVLARDLRAQRYELRPRPARESRPRLRLSASVGKWPSPSSNGGRAPTPRRQACPEPVRPRTVLRRPWARTQNGTGVVVSPRTLVVTTPGAHNELARVIGPVAQAMQVERTAQRLRRRRRLHSRERVAVTHTPPAFHAGLHRSPRHTGGGTVHRTTQGITPREGVRPSHGAVLKAGHSRGATVADNARVERVVLEPEGNVRNAVAQCVDSQLRVARGPRRGIPRGEQGSRPTMTVPGGAGRARVGTWAC